MVKHIRDIDFLVVKNEAEALISESNLIKINNDEKNTINNYINQIISHECLSNFFSKKKLFNVWRGYRSK